MDDTDGHPPTLPSVAVAFCNITCTVLDVVTALAVKLLSADNLLRYATDSKYSSGDKLNVRLSGLDGKELLDVAAYSVYGMSHYSHVRDVRYLDLKRAEKKVINFGQKFVERQPYFKKLMLKK